jgi:hypothetical protein
MAVHLSGYLVAASRGDGLRGATGAGRAQPRERIGASLLVDRASDVLAAAAIASSVEHAVGDSTGGAMHG